MISVLSQPSTVTMLKDRHSQLELNELGNLQDSVQPFTKLIVRSGRTTIRLHCTIPTWSTSADNCVDLLDLNELRSRFLLFIHDLIQSLRSSGIAASYTLAPSSASSLCLAYALPPNATAAQINWSDIEELQKDRGRFSKRENVLLADFDQGPCLIVT